MSINIQLTQRHAVYTNMDVISGKVNLYLNREESFTAIRVKLEGESKTRLAHPLGTRMGDRGESEIELHKLLYDVATVFPTSAISGAKAYTLPPGSHEFPFSFKIPFVNACNPYNIKTLKMGGLTMDMRDNNQHTKKTLPPTLTGFPGEAEIKYFVKATAERPSFLKENFRAVVPFKFLPIEPPRAPPNTRETYGRRKHQFSDNTGPVGRPGFFRKPSASTSNTSIAPYVSVDARLPDPAIVTSNEPLSLRVLVTKLNDSPEAIFLRTFHITLWAHTKIRAHELERIEVTSWVLCSYANMMERLVPERDPSSPTSASNPSNSNPNSNNSTRNSASNADTKDLDGSDNLYPMLLPQRLWATNVLPASVPPSFSTCNLQRWYELEISVGLSWGSPGRLRPELTVQPIRLKVDVYSGIAPSPALLSAAANAAARQQQQVHGAGPSVSISGPQQPQPPQQPPRPGFAGLPHGIAHHPQQQQASVDPGAAGPSSAQAAAPPAPPYDEPPPSYEDAMADDLAPVDGPRRDYHVDNAPPVLDSKRAW